MLSLLTFPTPTDTIAQASVWANPWLQEFWPLIYIGVGIFVFGLMISWLIRLFTGGFAQVFTPKKQYRSLESTELERLRYFDKGGKNY